MTAFVQKRSRSYVKQKAEDLFAKNTGNESFNLKTTALGILLLMVWLTSAGGFLLGENILYG